MRHALITLMIITGVVICSWEAGVVPGEALRARDQQPCTKLRATVSHSINATAALKKPDEKPLREVYVPSVSVAPFNLYAVQDHFLLFLQ